MRYKAMLLCLPILLSIGLYSEARMPEPETVPSALKGAYPHDPRVSHYYLDVLVKQHLMTQEEADNTQSYLIFRNARRHQDLKEVEGMPKEARRAVMKHKRALRGNPLVEYANYCGMTLERARQLMDIMHQSDKGSKYYNEAKG